MSFPSDLHSAAVSDSHLPCHAPIIPFFSRPRHSTPVEKRPVGYLPSFGFFRPRRGVPRRLLSEAYQSQMQSDASGHCETKQRLSWMRKRVVAAHYIKDNLLNCWTSSSDIFGYHADFCKGYNPIGAWQGRGMTCELTAQHGHGVLCVNQP